MSIVVSLLLSARKCRSEKAGTKAEISTLEGSIECCALSFKEKSVMIFMRSVEYCKRLVSYFFTRSSSLSECFLTKSFHFKYAGFQSYILGQGRKSQGCRTFSFDRFLIWGLSVKWNEQFILVILPVGAL